MNFRSIYAIFLALFAVLGLGIASQAEDYPHLLFGNPSKATDDPKNKDNFLLKKDAFAVSYNDSKGTPNWVSWQLTIADMDGNVPRKPVFDSEVLPEGFGYKYSKSYTGSGFDRGHMCPHSDRLASRENELRYFCAF